MMLSSGAISLALDLRVFDLLLTRVQDEIEHDVQESGYEKAGDDPRGHERPQNCRREHDEIFR